MAQLFDHLPMHTFRRCVAKYPNKYPVLKFSHFDQFACMAFAQLTYRESLRDIEICLRAHNSKLYHLGIRGRVSRSTLADANETRDAHIYEDFALALIKIARKLYAGDSFAVDIDNTVYALDTTTIDLCLSLFPWARFRKNKAAVRLHTLLDIRGNIPSFILISDGKLHDIHVLDHLIYEPGSFYVMDRGFIDFSRLYHLHNAQAFFVIRAKKNLQYRRLYSQPIDKETGLRCDQTIVMTGTNTQNSYPVPLRRVKFYDAEQDRLFVFLTNNLDLPAITITQLYKSRWQVELFFKWIKQHLRIKAFFGTSENAVRTQIWIAISVYVLVAIVKKRLHIDASLYTMLQALSLALFEKSTINQIVENIADEPCESVNVNQLNLFD